MLSFANQPDYETRLDSDNNNKYEVTVEATDETNNTGEFMLTVVVTNFDEPPELSPEDGQIEYDEDRTDSVETFRATDPEGESITWDLSGSDRGDFEINNGTLTFADQPDHETPVDSNRDNIYQVTVEADDGTKTSRSNYTITVVNVSRRRVRLIFRRFSLKWIRNCKPAHRTPTTSSPPRSPGHGTGATGPATV